MEWERRKEAIREGILLSAYAIRLPNWQKKSAPTFKVSLINVKSQSGIRNFLGGTWFLFDVGPAVRPC